MSFFEREKEEERRKKNKKGGTVFFSVGGGGIKKDIPSPQKKDTFYWICTTRFRFFFYSWRGRGCLVCGPECWHGTNSPRRLILWWQKCVEIDMAWGVGSGGRGFQLSRGLIPLSVRSWLCWGYAEGVICSGGRVCIWALHHVFFLGYSFRFLCLSPSILCPLLVSPTHSL